MSSEGRNSNNGLVVILVAVIVGVVLLGICGLGLGFFFVARTVQTNAASFPIPQDQVFVQGAMKEANDEANAPILSPGGSITHDGITLTLEKVQRGNVTVREDGQDVVLKNHFVLTYKFENRSTDVILQFPKVGLQKCHDNIGNKVESVTTVYSHNGEKNSLEIKPGEAKNYYDVVTTSVDSATSFKGVLRWKTTSNGDYHLARLKFTSSEVTNLE